MIVGVAWLSCSCADDARSFEVMPWRLPFAKVRRKRVVGDPAPAEIAPSNPATLSSVRNAQARADDVSPGASHLSGGSYLGEAVTTTTTTPPPPPPALAAAAVNDAQTQSDPLHIKPGSVSISERIWNRAYDSIVAGDETSELADKYLKALAVALGPGSTDPSDSARPELPVDLHDSATRQTHMKMLIKEGQRRIARTTRVMEKIGTVIEFVQYAKGAIDVAVETNPQAALPWAGVCVGLEVSSRVSTMTGQADMRQILMNPVKSHRSNLDGISYVTSWMSWYCALTDHLLSSDNILVGSESYEAVQSNLEESVVALYKSILLYQMKSVCKYYQNQGWSFLRGLANLDDWDTMLRNVTVAEKRLQEDSDHYTNQQVRSQLRTLVEIAKQKRSLLGDVQLVLKDYTSFQMRMQIDKDEKVCLKDLFVVDPRHDMSDIEDEKDKLLDDAYQWILDTPEYAQFTNWQKEAHDPVQCRLLWIKGNAGTGKTMLLIGIIRQLSEQSSVLAPHLAYFFCRGTGNKDQCDATATLRTLIWLLLFQQPQLRSYLLSEYEFKGSALFSDRNAFTALREIFLSMLQDVKFSPAYLIVDALDECSERLDRLFKLISDSLSVTTKVKWLVSGRPEVDISMIGCSDTLVELDAERLLQPVTAYIDYKLSDLSRIDGYTPEVLIKISNEIQRRAQNTFLWVALVFKELRSVNGWDAAEIVNTMPSRLSELYAHVMNRIKDEKGDDLERCKKVLVAATLAYRPLSLAELPTVAGLPGQSLVIYVQKCRSFLMVKNTDNTVHLIHQSAKQYLVANLLGTFQNGVFGQAHLDISDRSIKAISQLQRNVCSLRGWGSAREEARAIRPNPLDPLRYSCAFWARHRLDAISEGTVADAAFVDCAHFLENSFLVWLECLSLMDQVPDGIHVIRQLLKALLSNLGVC